MATYLQGVEDYIPQFQPFDPDLNFYANVLQTKQTQYDSNWKALNKIYGQYFYSDLSRENNIAKKDELIKQIDFNLRRISGLDLSLEQNVEQALQVFKPFYEDQFLMKDMAWTKNYINNRTGALNLKNSKDEKNREMYWDTGVRAMDYMREEFRSVSDDESLRFQNVEYTPYKNINKLYMDLAKASGIQAETPSWSEDGRYKIITKNGKQIIEPLTYLFKAHASNDPQLQDIYRTQAYVNRKDYVTQNASRFEGDLVAAERAYLTEQYGTIQNYVNQNKAESSQEKVVNDTNKREAVQAIESGNGTMFTEEYLRRLEEASGPIDATDAYNTQLQETMSDGNSTSTTNSYTPEQAEELDILRSKVDAGTAAMLMNQDIAEAAYVYSFKDYKVSVEADPYALESFRQSNREKLVEMKRKADEKNLAVEYGLKTNYYVIDNLTGAIKVNPKYDQTLVKVDVGSGATTEPFSMQEQNEDFIQEAGEEYGESWVKSMSGLLSAYQRGNNVSNGQLSGILGEGMMNYGRLSTDDMLSQHISAGMALKRATQPWTEGFLSRASRTVANPVAALKEMAESPAKFLQDKNFDQLKKVKDGVDRFMYERVAVGDQTALNYFGIVGQANGQLVFNPDLPETKMNVNFDRYLLSKRAYQLASDKNTEIFEKEFQDSESNQFAKVFWNDGQVLDEETFIKKAKDQLLSQDLVEGRIGELKDLDYLTGYQGDRSSKRIQQKYPLSAKQQKEFDAFITRVRNSKEGKYIFNDASRRDRLIRNWYAKEFNLDPTSGRKRSGYQTEEELSTLYKQYKEKLISLTVSNKLVSVTDSINDIKSEGGKFAITSQNSGRFVNLNANGTPGYNAFVQFASGDMQKLSKSQYEFSFDGNNVTGFDNDELESPDARRNIGMQVLSLYTNLLNKGEKFQDPELYQGQIGKEDRNKGVMVFYPKLDALQSLIGTDKKPGMITQEQANRMVQNGIAIAAPRSTWKNELFTNAKIGGLEAILNMTDNGKAAIKYEDPYSGGFQIIKDNTASTGYRVLLTTKQINDFTGKMVTETRVMPEVNFGKNLDMTYLMLRNQFAKQSSINISDYKLAVEGIRQQKEMEAYRANQPLTLKR